MPREGEACILILDEMNVRENLVYNKHTGIFTISIVFVSYTVVFTVLVKVLLLASLILGKSILFSQHMRGLLKMMVWRMNP